MKKILVISLLIAILGGLAYLYFTKTKSSVSSNKLYTLIPEHFPLALESADWNAIQIKTDSLAIGQFLKAQNWYQGTLVNLECLQELQSFATPVSANNKLSNTLFAYGNAGNGQLAILCALDNAPFQSVDDLQLALKANNINFTGYSFQDHQILLLKNFKNQEETACTIKDGFLIFSFQSSFVEEALLSSAKAANLEWESLLASKDPKADALLYIQAGQLNYLASYLVNAASINLLAEPLAFFDKAVYQISLYPEEIAMSGYSTAKEGSLMDSLQTSLSAENELASYLPSNTAFYNVLSTKNKSLLQSESLAIKSVYNCMGESFVHFVLECYDEHTDKRKGLLLSKGTEDALLHMQEIDAEFTEVQSFGEHSIYKSKAGQVFNQALFLPSFLMDTFYFSLLDDRIVLSSNIRVVEQVLAANDEQKFLKNSSGYSDFRSSLSTKSNLDLYADLSLLQAYLSANFTSNQWQASLGKINFQFSNLGSKIFTQAKVQLKTEAKSNTKSLWSFQMDTIAKFQAQVLSNHITKEKEIITQDLANNIYLLSASGELLWKKKIDEQIMGEIYQVDYFKNNKLQYVFNTPSKIYIIDRNGDMVDGFPIALPAKASAPILVLNYDNAGKYRYFVPCENANIYGFEQNGAPLAGWNPKKNIGLVQSALGYGVYDNKDYLFCTNQEGKFYAFNRKGEERFPALNVGARDFILDKNSFVGGANGKLESIDLKGALSSQVLLDSSYSFFQKVFSPIQNSSAYAMASSSSFKLQASQWNNFASYTTEAPITGMEAHKWNNSLWFVLYTESNTLILDELATLRPGFALASSGKIAIEDLISGKDKLVIYNDLQGKLQVLELKWTN
ncbi:MAG: hypothetical protein H6579_03050 [Chitinophagales bacterium]|nr:hypothetical protein [Chitinophagales bacterium]